MQFEQSCRILCDLTDRSLPGPSVHGIFQAKILEWVAISFSRDLPEPMIGPSSLASPALAGRDSLPLSHLGSPYNTHWTSKTKKVQTNLRETAGSVLDQHNKVDIARELYELFGFPVHLKVI